MQPREPLPWSMDSSTCRGSGCRLPTSARRPPPGRSCHPCVCVQRGMAQARSPFPVICRSDFFQTCRSSFSAARGRPVLIWPCATLPWNPPAKFPGHQRVIDVHAKGELARPEIGALNASATIDRLHPDRRGAVRAIRAFLDQRAGRECKHRFNHAVGPETSFSWREAPASPVTGASTCG